MENGTHEFVVLDNVLVEHVRTDPHRCTDNPRLLVRLQLLQRVVQVDLDAQPILQQHVRRLRVRVRVRRWEQWTEQRGSSLQLGDGFRRENDIVVWPVERSVYVWKY